LLGKKEIILLLKWGRENIILLQQDNFVLAPESFAESKKTPDGRENSSETVVRKLAR